MVLVFRPSGFALEGLGVVWGHGGSVWVQNLSDSDGHCGLSVVLSDSVLAASAASPPKLTSCSSEEKGVQVFASGCGVMRPSGRFREFARLGASSAQMQQQGSHDDATIMVMSTTITITIVFVVMTFWGMRTLMLLLSSAPASSRPSTSAPSSLSWSLSAGDRQDCGILLLAFLLT